MALLGRRAPFVLCLELSREVVESSEGVGLLRAEPARLYEMEVALERAGRDDKIAGLLLTIDHPELGWAKAESLARAVRAFRDGGKPSLAAVSGAGNAAFLVAAASGRVLLDPSSTLDLQSLSSESLFFKDLLGELGVDPELDQVGEFKTAGETFTRRESSEAQRHQIDELLADLEEQMLARIGEGRSLAVEAVREAVRRGPLLPHEALSLGLVDEVGTEDEAKRLLRERVGSEFRSIGAKRYVAKGRLRRRLWHWRRPRVALVHAVGIITSTSRPSSFRGPRALSAKALSEILEGLRAHPRVRAVVLRVESPGGGAVASDRIRRAVEATAKEKPVVVSMGDVAASGGYYLATAASSVVAEASTFTGSIGVLGGKFVVRRLLDRLGIHREGRASGPNAGFHSPLRSFRAEERERHREFLRHFYEKKFLPAVAEGRNLSIEAADALGRGRVWTGRQARERGLVDRLGGLSDAIDVACEKAGVARERVRISVHAPRRRLRDLIPFGGTEMALSELVAFASVAVEIAKEDVLFLMPPWLRIR